MPLAQGFYLGRPAVPWPVVELGAAKGLPAPAPPPLSVEDHAADRPAALGHGRRAVGRERERIAHAG